MLRVDDLRTFYRTRQGLLKAVDGVSFNLEKGEILGLVGESACGKTTVALSIIRLLPSVAEVMGGRILFQGDDLLGKTERAMRDVRWGKISIIFQGALNSLNPVLPVKEQIAEAMKAHGNVTGAEVDATITRLFKAVGLDPERRSNYPHEFSGGMKQRIMIAMALACNPEIVIADEPTTALDVIVQRQILELIRTLRDEFHISMILITHDLSVVAQLCDRAVIMYAGKVVEIGDIHRIFESPTHPYTRALLKSIPKMEVAKTRELSYIPGSVPDLAGPVPACRFYGRCPYGQKVCQDVEPRLDQTYPDSFVACHFWRHLSER
ncbi:MAG TPA: ABC transporter ATP-binding protein [Terriglobales bacterium]|nr:ABC transporter ATP-binding protein [Terriglobales bacterium]